MTTKPKLLVTRRVFPEVVAHLEAVFDVEPNPGDELWSLQALRARAADKDALYVVTSDQVDQDLLDACPRLRMVASMENAWASSAWAASARRSRAAAAASR